MYHGIEVLKENLIVSVNDKGEILSLSGKYIPNISAPTEAKISKEEAEEVVKGLLANATIETNNLAIYVNDLIYDIVVYDNDYLK